MTRIYQGLLRKIEQLPRRVVMDRRLHLSRIRKGAIALRARWGAGGDAGRPAVGGA